MDPIREIYAAKKQLLKLEGNWGEAIRNNQKEIATQIRSNCNKIRQEIKHKYKILL